jgi:nucleoside-diphosphate-sugar epimerase
LITGATGFVGKALSLALGSEYEIWTLIRNRGRGGESSRAIQADLARPEALNVLREKLGNVPFRAVLHAAAHTPRMSSDNALEDLIQANVLGTHRLLTALMTPPGRFAYFSTIDVYGHPTGGQVVSETMSPAPLSYYAVSKYAGERVVMSWARNRGLPAAIFRLSQVYGPGDLSSKAIPSFCSAAKRKRRPVVHGSGEELRQPIHIDDVVSAVCAWLRLPAVPESALYLLGGPEQIRILELARLVLKVHGRGGEPDCRPLLVPAEPVHYRLDFARTQEALGWEPRVFLEQGIRSVLDASPIEVGE